MFLIKVILKLEEGNQTENQNLNPGTHGMNAPSSCSIIIIAGILTTRSILSSDSLMKKISALMISKVCFVLSGLEFNRVDLKEGFGVSATIFFCQTQLKLSYNKGMIVIITFFSAKFLKRIDRVMTLVNNITEDIEHMPLAAFIFKEKEGDQLHFSNHSRLKVQK